jgi:hypothetical protein
MPGRPAGTIIIVGLPSAVTIAGWLLTGREQPQVARVCRCAENRAGRVGHHFAHRRPPWPGAAERADDGAGPARAFDPGDPHQHRDHRASRRDRVGGTIGVGTLAYALAIGPLVQLLLLPRLTVPAPATGRRSNRKDDGR